MRRVAVLLAVLAMQILAAVGPATAGGSHLQPVRDRYEVGEVATLVGYTSGGQLGWAQDGPFHAYLVADETVLWATGALPPDHVALGPLTLTPKGRNLRVSLSFAVPRHLAPGIYNVTYCNDPCTTGLGDLIGGAVAVAVDPPRPVQREWPADEPEIANLADDAVLSGPGSRYTAGDLRAGRVGPRSSSPAPSAPVVPSERLVPSEPTATTTVTVPAPAESRPTTAENGSPPGRRVWSLLLAGSLFAAGALVWRGRAIARRKWDSGVAQPGPTATPSPKEGRSKAPVP